MDKIIRFLSALLAIINPLANETRGQKIGTYISLISAAIGVILLALQVFGTVQVSTPLSTNMVGNVDVEVVEVWDEGDADIFEVSEDAACTPDNLTD